MVWCSLMAVLEPILALNCRLQLQQVNSDCKDSDVDSLAFVLRSLRFLPASQIIYSSY